MGKDSKIGWTTHTHNGWTRCTEVVDEELGADPACTNCYARLWAGRAKHPTAMRDGALVKLPIWGADAPRTPTKTWKRPLEWAKNAAARGVRERVFMFSLADVFEEHADILPETREQLWKLCEDIGYALDVLLLTKRPENVPAMVPARWMERWPAHIWMGTTVVTQAFVDKRVPLLRKIPAPVRFLSIEPQVEPIDLQRHLDGIGWVIGGGESGGIHKVRPYDLGWARSLRDQCARAGVPFFFKQAGRLPIVQQQEPGLRCVERLDEVGARIIGQGWRVALADDAGANPAEWPADLRVQQFPTTPRAA